MPKTNRWTILVRLVLPRTGLCNCDLFMDGTYLVCRLPDLGPPNHVGTVDGVKRKLLPFCFSPVHVYDVHCGVHVSLEAGPNRHSQVSRRRVPSLIIMTSDCFSPSRRFLSHFSLDHHH
jgi:hypothetical protein